nr:Tad domain-containing protein [Victivallales bacterium]
MFKRRKCEEGQTLILGVLSIIVLLIATLIIFDLSSVIKTKLRSQTAVDAAALTGAKWQAYSLNAIGELNLVQVCTVIVNGHPRSHLVKEWSFDRRGVGDHALPPAI